MSTVRQLLDRDDLHSWYLDCLEDIRYNQQLFISSKYHRLDALCRSL